MIRAFVQGVRDGREQGADFTVGRTFAAARRNEAYDRGVNLGIRLAGR